MWECMVMSIVCVEEQPFSSLTCFLSVLAGKTLMHVARSWRLSFGHGSVSDMVAFYFFSSLLLHLEG